VVVAYAPRYPGSTSKTNTTPQLVPTNRREPSAEAAMDMGVPRLRGIAVRPISASSSMREKRIEAWPESPAAMMPPERKASRPAR
jgi:hypothetical protein